MKINYWDNGKLIQWGFRVGTRQILDKIIHTTTRPISSNMPCQVSPFRWRAPNTVLAKLTAPCSDSFWPKYSSICKTIVTPASSFSIGGSQHLSQFVQHLIQDLGAPKSCERLQEQDSATSVRHRMKEGKSMSYINLDFFHVVRIYARHDT